MICEKCKKNAATVHYRYNENGNITELHLCSQCAKNDGLMHDDSSGSYGFFSDKSFFGDGLGKIPFLSSFGSSAVAGNVGIHQKVCPGCGLTENELRSGGKLGCEKCYSVFSGLVTAMLNKMHMSTEYKGKLPENAGKEISVTRKIEGLKADMSRAVEEQNYEEAAKLRDMIRELENSIHNDREVGGDV